jgi:hypothetical protein
MPAAHKAGRIIATLIGAWLIMAAIVLSFAVLGGTSVKSTSAAFRRPVLIQRQRAPTPGG